MPIIQSAIKKVRKDKKRTAVNSKYKTGYKKAVGALKKTDKKKSAGLLTKLYSDLDKAVKKNIIHKKKAKRLKSKFSKLLKNTK